LNNSIFYIYLFKSLTINYFKQKEILILTNITIWSLTLRYNNELFRASKDLMFTTRLSIFTTTFCRKIQKEQKKHNRLIVFFTTFSMLINFTTSRFRKKNLKSLTTNEEQ